MIPNYLIIGVQKSGTTSMINYFNQHPQIFLYEDEIHFFDSYQYLKGKEYYENIFKKKMPKNKKFIGEKTPSYCFIPLCVPRIQKMYPTIKMIMVLREPIQRCFSQYMMICKKNNIKASNQHFYDTIKSIEHIKLKDITSTQGYYYLQRGFYDEQIRHLYKYFPRKNIYIGVFEIIKENQEKEYNKMYEFIGASTSDTIDYSEIERKGEYKFELSLENKQYLYSIYKKYNAKLYKILGYPIKEWENYYKKNLII